MVRTDSAAVFYILLSLALILAAYRDGRLHWHLLAGLAIGFGIGTKYVLAALAPIYLLAALLRLWQTRKTDQLPRQLAHQVAGLLVIVAGFAISTPYFFLDFQTAWNGLLFETRSEHLGADGLSAGGNLWFYLTSALPRIMTWPQLIVALAAAVVGVWRRRIPRLLLLSFVLLYLAGVSLSPLHWMRWALLVAPLLALFAAEGLRLVAVRLAARAELRNTRTPQLLLALALLLAVQPIYATVLQNTRQSRPTTRILARQWLLEHAPAGSKIAQEWYAAPLADADFDVVTHWALGQERSLAEFRSEGVDYLVASSAMYGRFYANPERSAAEVAFYELLSEEGVLMQEFEPSPTRGGPTIRIYRLP